MFFKDSSRLKIYRQLKRLQRWLIFTIFIKEPTISAMKEAFFEAQWTMPELSIIIKMPTRRKEEGLHTQSISAPHMHRIAKRLTAATTTTKDAKTCGALLDSAFGCCNKKKTMFFKDSSRQKKSRVTRKIFKPTQWYMHMYYTCINTYTHAFTHTHDTDTHMSWNLLSVPTKEQKKKKKDADCS